jgi:hypothetical protein
VDVKTVLQEADEMLPAPVRDRSTLVIHMVDPSTDFLKAIYQGKGYDEINGRIDQQDLLTEIKRHPRVFMLGHGGPLSVSNRH